MNKNKKTPIAIFTYNRPKHARQLFVSLLKCSRLDECDVYIFCDGIKKTEHTIDVLATRQVVREFAPLLNTAYVIEHEKNKGVDHSIVSGVTELCAQYGRIIVLEDDLTLHPSFIQFMLESLTRYQDDAQVALVSGYIFPVELKHMFDTLFLPLTSAWGWATWERAWKLFDWDAPGALEALQDDELRHRFDLYGAYPYSQFLIETLNKKERPWDILFYWAVFSRNKLGLHPAYSLVRNEGFDGSGVHFTKRWTGYNPLTAREMLWAANHKFTWPTEVRSDEQALHAISSFLSSIHRTEQSFFRNVLKNWISVLKKNLYQKGT